MAWSAGYAFAGSGTWGTNGTTGDDDGSAADLVDPVISKQPFYSSGWNAEFTLINGGYQPIVAVKVSFQVGRVCACARVHLHKLRAMCVQL